MRLLLKLQEQILIQQLMKSFGILPHMHCFLERHLHSHGVIQTHQMSMIGEYSSGKITMTTEPVGQCMTVGILLKDGILPTYLGLLLTNYRTENRTNGSFSQLLTIFLEHEDRTQFSTYLQKLETVSIQQMLKLHCKKDKLWKL